MDCRDAAEKERDTVISLRRHFHENPELSQKEFIGHGALPARHHLQHIASPTARRHGRLDRFSWRDPDDAGFSNDASDGRGASDAAYSMRLATVFLRLPPPGRFLGQHVIADCRSRASQGALLRRRACMLIDEAIC